MEKIGYVYLTTNLVNGKMYVGQHLSEGFDVKYKGSGTAVNRAFKKYGWDNFKCEVICWCSTQTQLNEAEDNYIRLLNTMSPNGYNLRGGGSKGKPCKESCKKMSEAQKKYFKNEENRKKMSETKKKYYESEEARKNMSEIKKKYFENEENRKKQSEALKGRVAWNKGKTGVYSEETRKNMSEAHKGQTPTDETRKNMSEAKKKYWENKENRKKQSEAQINHPKKSKKVYQYTLNGEFAKEWESLHEIKRVLGYDIRNISACCNGRVKTSHKHLWSFKPLIKRELVGL